MGAHRKIGRTGHRRRRLAVLAMVLGVVGGLVAAAAFAAGGSRPIGLLRPSATSTMSIDPRLHRTPEPPDRGPRPGPGDAPVDRPSPASTALRAGDHGPAVLALQQRLNDLGYPVRSLDGVFGSETLHSLIAFQKVSGLARDAVAGPATLAAIEHPVIPRPRSGGSAFRVEIDLTHQVLYLVMGDRVTEIYDVSTGSGRPYVQSGVTHVAHTPTGSFAIERKIDALHESPLGLLYRPAYFVGGYAIHGSASVPAYPASHGCVRVTDQVMDSLFDRLAIGTPVTVY